MAAPALEREIVQRMGHDPFTGSPQQWIEVVVDREEGFYTVQLFERDLQGRTLGTRRLRESAGNCHELDEAIVLAVALIIDPTAELLPRTEPQSHVESPGPPSKLTGTSEPAAESPPWPTRILGPVPKASPALSADVQPSAAGFAGAHVVAVLGVLPEMAPGAEWVAEVPVHPRSHAALRLSALYLPEQRQHHALGDISYGLTALEVGACGGASNAWLGWFACAAFGVGAIHAVVHAPIPVRPGDRLWAALRLEAGLRLRVSGPLWLETRLFDLIAPRRWEFRVKSESATAPVFTQSILMPGLAAGLGVRF